MQLHQVADHQHRMVAAAFAHPEGWQAESMVRWNFQHYTLPVKVFARAFDPQNGLGLEFFPAEQYCWLQPDFMMRRPGTDLQDGTYLFPPMSAADALQKVTFPRFRAGLQNFRVTKVTPAPDLAQRLDVRNLGGTGAEGVSVLVEYVVNGQPFEEEFFALKYVCQPIPSYGAAGCILQTNWGFARLLSFRVPKGQLGPSREMFWSMVRSLKINPQWEQLCGQVMQQMQMLFQQYLQAGYANIQAAGQMSRQISAMNDSMLQQMEQHRQQENQAYQMQRAQSQSASEYSTTDAFSDYIMGRDTYEDSYTGTGVSQHEYFNYVYTDDQGNYKYSDTPLSDPSAGETSWFHEMKKKLIGDR